MPPLTHQFIGGQGTHPLINPKFTFVSIKLTDFLPGVLDVAIIYRGLLLLTKSPELAFSSEADGFLELGNAIKDFGGSEDVSSSASRAGDVLVP